MQKQAWWKIATFVALIWGVWALLERPKYMVTRRPSSIGFKSEDPRNLARMCHEKARESYPSLAQNLLSKKHGVFSDRASFNRPYRLAFNEDESFWAFEAQVGTNEAGQEVWALLAKLWDVDGDSFPDEAMLFIDPVRGRQWTKLVDTIDWNFFARLQKNGEHIVWIARLDADEWSPAGGCFAWSNPIVALTNWAMMQYRWSPSLAMSGTGH